MKTDEYTTICFRISKKYRQYLEFLVKQRGMNITEYFIEIMLNDFVKNAEVVAEHEAIMKVVPEFGITDRIASAMRRLDDVKSVFDAERYEKFCQRFEVVYEETLDSLHKEISAVLDTAV